MRPRAMRADQIENGAGVMAPVGHRVARRGNASEQCRRDPLVRNLPGDRHELDRQAIGADNDVDLAAKPAPGASDGGVRIPLFSPAECWWARTIELSMRCSASGASALKALKMHTHTPFLDQRL